MYEKYYWQYANVRDTEVRNGMTPISQHWAIIIYTSSARAMQSGHSNE